MDFKEKKVNGFTVISVNKTLHMASDIAPIFDKVESLIAAGSINIAIKFQDDSYLSSRTGAIIIKSWEVLNEVNGEFALININENISEFLRIIDLEHKIKTFSTEQELA